VRSRLAHDLAATASDWPEDVKVSGARSGIKTAADGSTGGALGTREPHHVAEARRSAKASGAGLRGARLFFAVLLRLAFFFFALRRSEEEENTP
jgi:hypothetical protein